MAILPVLAMLAAAARTGTPVLWLTPAGEVQVDGRPVPVRETPGADRVPIAGGFAYDFTGQRGGILLADLPPLRLTGSMTLSVWLYLRSYTPNGEVAQVLFRGDDRAGLDPYELAVVPDGRITFLVENDDNVGCGVTGEIPLRRWIYIVASLDAKSGEMDFWLDGRRVSMVTTTCRPFGDLVPAYSPGVGIGNVQNDRGPHNEPLDGLVADLRLYRGVFTPRAIGDSTPPWAKTGR
ncbi:MAG TPA: LamG-like jellyroll fold domain-containing protein [Fimbriimonadaceae bacterium]|nr:LamG-like jellyroll fold domain-containing protein [Fimbriimonadaceae bacterium]